MLNLKKSVLKYKNQDGNMEDIGAIVVTTPQRCEPLIVNYNITPYSDIKNAYDNKEDVWAMLKDETTITVPEKVVLEAGVYDENDNLLVDWAELTNYKTGYVFDMDNDYSYDISSGFGLQSFRNFETGEIYNLYPFSSAMGKNTDLNPYTKVVIEEGSTKIGDYSFALSDILTTIIIPDSVTSISNTAFFRCDNLKTIYYSGSAVNNGNNWGATNATVLPYSEAFNKLVDKTVERSIIATLSSSIDDTFTFSTVHESNKYELYCSEKNGWSCKTTLINTEEYFNNQKNKPNGIVGLDDNGLIEDTLISDDIARVDDLMTIPYIDLVKLGVTATINDDGSIKSTGFMTEYGSNDGDLLIEATQSEFVKFNVSIKGTKTINKVVVIGTSYVPSGDKYVYTSALVDGQNTYLIEVRISLLDSFVDVSLHVNTTLPSKDYVDTSIETAKTVVKNELLNGAGSAYDSLRELGDLIDDNTDAIEALEKIASSKADAEHTHNYAGSSSAGGAANSALKLTNPRKIHLTQGASGASNEFDGSGNAYIPVTDIKESYLSWGGKSHKGMVSPLGASLSSEHSANRLAYLNPNALTFERSDDGGSTWKPLDLNKDAKVGLVTTSSQFPVGIENPVTTNHRTRMVIAAQDGTSQYGYLYTRPRKLLLNVSTPHGLSVMLETKTGEDNASWTSRGTYELGGWNGWNEIQLDFSTFGGQLNQKTNVWYMRLTFLNTSINSSYANTKSNILGLRLFGETCWTKTSNLGDTGHLYSYDVYQNATFPAGVIANGFIGELDGNANSATKATQDAYGNVITETYETKTDASNKLAEAKTYTDNAVAQKSQVQIITWEADD